MPAPDLPAATRDLSDAELVELDDLLAALPEPAMPMEIVMLKRLIGLILLMEQITNMDSIIFGTIWFPRRSIRFKENIFLQ